MKHLAAIASLSAIVLNSCLAQIDFSSEIAPIFAENCYQCHGSETQKSELRLDSPAMIRKGGGSGEPLFIPGKAAESHLIKLVAHTDPDETMPPFGKGNPLSPAQVNILKTWIDQGATMPDHSASEQSNNHWSFQPVQRHGLEKMSIDELLATQMLPLGLTPSPRADRLTLIRRLYLVIHGLPPSQAQITAFLSDPATDELAWSNLIDRALASPRFGERLARLWLDTVRFAESNGFETNRERPSAFHFRDYVIDSFNSDKPYNQFIKEQIAGDALDADVGTGFLVAGSYDIVKSPDINLTLTQRQDELADMVNTTGTTFLALTLGCARCHNHKFDPISQKDFYAFQAVFAGVSYGDRPVKIPLTPSSKTEISKLREQISAEQTALARFRDIPASHPANARPPVNATLNSENFAPTETKFVRFNIHATNQSQPCIDELMVFDPNETNIALGATPTSSGNLQGYPIHKLEHINDGKSGNEHSWICDQESGWVQLELTKTQTITRIEWARDRNGTFADRIATNYSIEGSTDGKNWFPLASSADRSPFNNQADPNAFLTKLQPADANAARQLINNIAAKSAQLATLESGYTAWVGNFSQPGKTHRLYRGDPLAPREEIAPDIPESMGTLALSLDEPEQQRRIQVANWIASEDNPLTARVMANRLWQFVFGTGIVDTPSDFGTNGTTPTHPELLDWLATEFTENNWSNKHLLRLMLSSAAFQQSSQPRNAALKIDAHARYLWRFPPRRLEAEALRDSILAAAGTLDLENTSGPGFYLLDVDRENVVHYTPKEVTGPPEWRRMIYMVKIRQEQDAVFGSFDCPDGNQTIPKRNRSTTPLQALNLFNSKFVIQQAELLAQRLTNEPAKAAKTFELLYGRQPSAAEITDSESFIAEHGVEAFCRAMLNTNEFMFIE